jgi:iron(II)-dependent oxidoreductase
MKWKMTYFRQRPRKRPPLYACILHAALFLSVCCLAGCGGDDGESTPQRPDPIVVGDRVLIPAGFVVLGDDPDGYGNYTVPQNENPVWVDSFYLDRREVSNQQYADFLNAALDSNRIYITDDYVLENGTNHLFLYYSAAASRIRYVDSLAQFEVESGYEDVPVVLVSWFGAKGYAEFYGERLPTESEWEKAARGVSTEFGSLNNVGVGYKYPWGNDPPNDFLANFGNNFGSPEPVDSYSDGMSWFGAFNLAGNVSEWTATQIGSTRVRRGGSFLSNPDDLRVAARYLTDPIATHPSIGFRCAADP